MAASCLKRRCTFWSHSFFANAASSFRLLDFEHLPSILLLSWNFARLLTRLPSLHALISSGWSSNSCIGWSEANLCKTKGWQTSPGAKYRRESTEIVKDEALPLSWLPFPQHYHLKQSYITTNLSCYNVCKELQIQSLHACCSKSMASTAATCYHNLALLLGNCHTANCSRGHGMSGQTKIGQERGWYNREMPRRLQCVLWIQAFDNLASWLDKQSALQKCTMNAKDMVEYIRALQATASCNVLCILPYPSLSSQCEKYQYMY